MTRVIEHGRRRGDDRGTSAAVVIDLRDLADMTEAHVRDVLRQVVDPELGINIVDLGLVYGVDLTGDRVHVRLTMTTPACPLGRHLADQAQSAIRSRVPGAHRVLVELVWDPPWAPDMMTDAARAQLGWPAETPNPVADPGRQ